MEKFVIRNAENDKRFLKEHTPPGALYWNHGRWAWVSGIEDASVYPYNNIPQVLNGSPQQVVWDCDTCGTEIENTAGAQRFFTELKLLRLIWSEDVAVNLKTDRSFCPKCAMQRQVEDLEKTGTGTFYLSGGTHRYFGLPPESKPLHIGNAASETLVEGNQIRKVSEGVSSVGGKWVLYHFAYNGKKYRGKIYPTNSQIIHVRRIKS